jgi:hypothetical protein
MSSKLRVIDPKAPSGEGTLDLWLEQDKDGVVRLLGQVGKALPYYLLAVDGNGKPVRAIPHVGKELSEFIALTLDGTPKVEGGH